MSRWLLLAQVLVETHLRSASQFLLLPGERARIRLEGVVWAGDVTVFAACSETEVLPMDSRCGFSIMVTPGMPPVTKISSSVSFLRHALSSQWMWRTHSCILSDN